MSNSFPSCSSCGKTLSVKKNKTGLCRDCRNNSRRLSDEDKKEKVRKLSAEYRKNHPDKRRETKKKYYESHKDKWKEYSKNYKEKDPERYKKQRKERNRKNKEKAKAYREENKERSRKRYKEYSSKNKEKIRTRKKAYSESNKEKIRQRNHEYYIENKDRINKRNKEYKSKHPEQKRKNMALRRSVKKNVYANLTAEDVKTILSSGCFFCGSFSDLTIAHDIPISKGGATTRGNLFCLCRSCNSKMHTRTLPDVMVQLELPFS